MNSQVWWFVARSSGIVAWALLSMSVVWGLLLSTKVSTTRIAARRLRPAWLLGLHRHLGGLAVIFTVIHLIGIVADSYVTFSWAAVLVPMASEWKPGAVAFGVVAMYLLVAIEATSLAIRHLPRQLWRWVHRSSFVLYATATWHGVTAGTDAGNQWFRAAAWLSLVVVVGLTVRLVVVLRAKAGAVAAQLEPLPELEPEPELESAAVPIVRPAPPVPPSPPIPARRFAPAARPAPDRPPVVSALRSGIAPLPGSAPGIMMPVASSAELPSPTPPAPSANAPAPPLSTPIAAPPETAAPLSAVPLAVPVARPTAPPPPPPPPVPVERELVAISSGPSGEGAPEPPPTDS